MFPPDLVDRFSGVAPPADAWSLRAVVERDERIAVTRGVVQPAHRSEDLGVMITVVAEGGTGYAATADLSAEGLRRAGEEAREWARRAGTRRLFDPAGLPPPASGGSWSSPEAVPWEEVPLRDRIGLLREADEALHAGERIVDRSASLWRKETISTLFTSEGARIDQRTTWVLPGLSVTAARGSDSETRTLGGHVWGRQGGLEVLDACGFREAPPRLTAEALEQLDAPHCPDGVRDVVLAPDQMVLQVHESIGHPLELDRILGDERNYAGTSFVTPGMFGSFRYGSEHMNVTFDPTRPGELASFAFDDDGQPAARELLIREGILLRPLGGGVSRLRTGLDGVACARADGWNRPPIDRMANLNLEPGPFPLDELVAGVEDGIWMETNCSWSIDDSRNKFQFGCERGRRIVDGALGEVVRRPGYRGTSRTFWRSLDGVGNEDTLLVLGTPWCGKGEPNQIMRVGHAVPACRFRGVEVFGGVE